MEGINNMDDKQIINRYFSDLAKKRHKDNPKPKEYYQELQKKSVESRMKKKFSTDE